MAKEETPNPTADLEARLQNLEQELKVKNATLKSYGLDDPGAPKVGLRQLVGRIAIGGKWRYIRRILDTSTEIDKFHAECEKLEWNGEIVPYEGQELSGWPRARRTVDDNVPRDASTDTDLDGAFE